MKLIAGEQRFQGFSGETFRFLRGLAEQPSKAYWDSHREIYRSEVLIPMRHLLAALEAEFGQGKLLSMRRDNRFSPNPAPYKSISAQSSIGRAVCVIMWKSRLKE